MKVEKRVFQVELEQRAEGEEAGDSKLRGYAAVFNEVANIGGYFEEVLRSGAFAKSLTEADDVRALFNHNDNFVLGRSAAGTLRMSEDDRGLLCEIDIPDTQMGRDLRQSVSRGDINQMSFAFLVEEEAWTYRDGNELPLRELIAVRLSDVSVVTYPAYKGTSVQVRSEEGEQCASPELVLEEHRKDQVEKLEIAKLRLRLEEAA